MTYYSNEVYSLLDVVLGNIKEQTEKTYSAPFARISFVQQTSTDDAGRIIREYPPLIHGASHLDHNQSANIDIILKTLQAILIGLIISFVLCQLHQLYRQRKSARALNPIHSLPWRSAYTTITLIICFWTWLIYLGNAYHILGTDQVGNDTLYESIKGIRTGFLVGIFSTLFMLPIAIILGISAGYFRGVIDDIVQYLVTLVSSIPFILLAAASALLFQIFIEKLP